MKPSKKEDFPLMWVWDGAGPNPKDRKKHVCWVYSDSSCYSVSSMGDRTNWRNCEEIKEPKMRPMTRDEIAIKACEPWDYAVRYNGGSWLSPGSVVYNYTLERYEWCDTSSGTFGEPQKFEVEVSDDH